MAMDVERPTLSLGNSYYVVEAKLMALARCERRSGSCGLRYCRPYWFSPIRARFTRVAKRRYRLAQKQCRKRGTKGMKLLRSARWKDRDFVGLRRAAIKI